MALRLIIITDLDGSLLDHTGYSSSPAAPALRLIKRNSIPLVFATSKTRAEVEALQRGFGIDEPFIVENGAAAYVPSRFGGPYFRDWERKGRYRIKLLGVPYNELRDFLSDRGERFGIRGFGDMSVKEVMEATGLDRQEARRAMKREYSEPFTTGTGTAPRPFIQACRRNGYVLARGGRFCHLYGEDQDKGKAARHIIDGFTRLWNEPVVSIGIGDSPNDVSLLRAVDIPVLIPREDGTFIKTGIKPIVRAHWPGSKGWNDAVLTLINRLLKGTCR